MCVKPYVVFQKQNTVVVDIARMLESSAAGATLGVLPAASARAGVAKARSGAGQRPICSAREAGDHTWFCVAAEHIVSQVRRLRAPAAPSADEASESIILYIAVDSAVGAARRMCRVVFGRSVISVSFRDGFMGLGCEVPGRPRSARGREPGVFRMTNACAAWAAHESCCSAPGES
eukprot:CAMPEP_0118866406 /NCGR_PEP_ID=MMETSP1163-20130328/10333_1 /TAXON_ID=124430 /ORGANISM="Phaeomonas parva, Strain CCMP2877" /LENGTH=175 /DNA_ID=CAMNT_0006800719 /DNA_START=195 /DNA_END=723 /DNA_ORIENTATION=+